MDIDAIFVLFGNTDHYHKGNAPVVVKCREALYVTPKFMWPAGLKAVQHLQGRSGPDVGKAPLSAWLEACLPTREHEPLAVYLDIEPETAAPLEVLPKIESEIVQAASQPECTSHAKRHMSKKHRNKEKQKLFKRWSRFYLR